MFVAHPFLGSGFGTFATAFPRYRVFYDGFIVNNAHDDYLELLLETGLAVFGLVGGSWLCCIARDFTTFARHGSRPRLPYALLLW